jgi:ATP-dependent DNA helicase DinG
MHTVFPQHSSVPGKDSIKGGITLQEIFGPGGILEQRLSNYEYRASQPVMAEAVLDAIRQGHPLCVEAGTGTGKTLAYLIPALFSHKRVIVSTATKNLQDQIFFKDIPFIREHLLPDLAATYMKGRQNYLCLRKFHEDIAEETVFDGAGPGWKSLSQWVGKTRAGDRSELDWMQDDDPLWSHLDARSENCTGQRCSYFDDCYVTRMRQRALESDLIVVNHALFFANLALENDEIGRVLPDFSVLILDEGHEVEDTAATYFGKQVSNYQIEEFCRDVGKVLADSSEYKDQITRILGHSAAFFTSFPGLEGRYSLNLYPQHNGISVDLRKESPDKLESLQQSLQSLYHHLMKQSQRPADADPLIHRLEHLMTTLESIFDLEQTEDVYWFEKRGRGVFLHSNPIDVAPILQEKLFERADTTIVTSATLTTNKNFEYVKERLGIPEPKEVIVPGEFDYSQQSILYIPRSFPEPRSPRYFERALADIEEILEITQGHAFLLFTSFLQMDRVYRTLLERSPFPLFRQGERPKNELLELFKKTPRAVLCATSSFWQGVDVQGDALRVVIIDKLPFLVPTEPLVAARINRLEAKGENPFLRYTVPAAVITLKQGLGRLIRSRRDRGLLAVFDSRLRTRSYGRIFLESLPDCPVTSRIEDLRKFWRSKCEFSIMDSPDTGES